MKNESIARVTHEADRAIRASMGQEVPGWDRLEATLKVEWRSKIAAMKSADAITPKTRHESWMNDMVAAGWTQGGNDPNVKTHPAICSYEDLPEQVHLLDNVLVALVEVCTELGKDG